MHSGEPPVSEVAGFRMQQASAASLPTTSTFYQEEANTYPFAPPALPPACGASACDASALDALALNSSYAAAAPPPLEMPIQPPVEMAPMGMASSAGLPQQIPEHLQNAAAAAPLQYQSVRVRQPSTKVYGSDFIATAGGPLAEMSPRAEARAAAAAAAAAARKQAKEDAKRAAEEEAAAWAVAEGITMTPELGSMVRILQELFAAKHASVNKPFVDAAEAQAFQVSLHLVSVRTRLIAGEYSGIGPFASAVRDVFAACYLEHGHPERSALSKKCERLDAIFEQQVTLLPRAHREVCSLHAAPTSFLAPEGGSSAEAASSGDDRRSGRRQTQVAAPSTLRLVEMRKQAEAAALEHERNRVNKEKRENAVREAEAWGAASIDEASLDELRRSYDGASVCHFIASFVPVLQVPNFVLVEFEFALCFFSDASLLMRFVLEALLRHSNFPNGRMAPMPKTLPTMAQLTGELSRRMTNWSSFLKQVRDREERGQLIESEREPWLSEWVDGAGCREIVDRLGLQLPSLQAEMRASGGLASLTLTARVGLLHMLIEQVLVEDRDIWKRMEAADIAAQRASLLGRNAAGRWHYGLAALGSRVYSLASPWQKKPLPMPPHLVRAGERVEVEVAEKDRPIEWRGARVLELLPGGKGRFVVMVDGVDGAPDEDFIEIFTSPLIDREWRKMPKKEVKPKEEPKPKPPPAEPRAGGRRTRVTDDAPAAAAAPAAGGGHASKKQKATAISFDQKIEQRMEQVALLNTSDDGRSLMLLPPAAALPKPKGSDPKVDKEVHKAVLALQGEQEAAQQAYARLHQQSVIRLHEHVTMAASEAAMRAAEPPAAAPADAVSADAPAVDPTAADAEAALALKVANEAEAAERAAKIAEGRSARSAKRLQLSAEAFAAKEAEEAEAKAREAEAKLGAKLETGAAAAPDAAVLEAAGGDVKAECGPSAGATDGATPMDTS